MTTDNLALTAGDSSPPGSYVGFQAAFTGDLEPSAVFNGQASVIRMEVDLNGDLPILYFQVEGSYDQDQFTTFVTESEFGTQTFNSSDAEYANTGDTTHWAWTLEAEHVLYQDGATYGVTIDSTPIVVFNCDCPDTAPWQTLLELRTRMMVLGGYAAMAANPPPGKAAEIDEFLRTAQKTIYNAPANGTLRTERYFKWTMEAGQRYYGFADEEGNCKVLDPTQIKWVGFEDLNQAWYELSNGINPLYYTRVQSAPGWPSCYEVRSCIEVFPAPQAAYTLWVRGQFGLDALTINTDRTTIDSEAVFLLALGMMKTAYGKLGADQTMTMAGNYIANMVAKTHLTRRYVPRTMIPNPLTPPKFLPLGDQPA